MFPDWNILIGIAGINKARRITSREFVRLGSTSQIRVAIGRNDLGDERKTAPDFFGDQPIRCSRQNNWPTKTRLALGESQESWVTRKAGDIRFSNDCPQLRLHNGPSLKESTTEFSRRRATSASAKE